MSGIAEYRNLGPSAQAIESRSLCLTTVLEDIRESIIVITETNNKFRNLIGKLTFNEAPSNRKEQIQSTALGSAPTPKLPLLHEFSEFSSRLRVEKDEFAILCNELGRIIE